MEQAGFPGGLQEDPLEGVLFSWEASQEHLSLLCLAWLIPQLDVMVWDTTS